MVEQLSFVPACSKRPEHRVVDQPWANQDAPDFLNLNDRFEACWLSKVVVNVPQYVVRVPQKTKVTPPPAVTREISTVQYSTEQPWT